MSESSSIPSAPINQQIQKSKEKNLGGRPLAAVWLHFERKEKVGPGKYGAKCKYCSAEWKRGEVTVLEEHLANHCSNVPTLVLREFMEKIKNRESVSNNKKRKLDISGQSGQTSITDYHDLADLPEGRIQRINRALIKFFICCGVSFRIVEHPFFIDLLKELNAGYDPPTREYLSGRLLEDELSSVNSKVQADLDCQTNLTLGEKDNQFSLLFSLFLLFFYFLPISYLLLIVFVCFWL